MTLTTSIYIIASKYLICNMTSQKNPNSCWIRGLYLQSVLWIVANTVAVLLRTFLCCPCPQQRQMHLSTTNAKQQNIKSWSVKLKLLNFVYRYYINIHEFPNVALYLLLKNKTTLFELYMLCTVDESSLMVTCCMRENVWVPVDINYIKKALCGFKINPKNTYSNKMPIITYKNNNNN